MPGINQKAGRYFGIAPEIGVDQGRVTVTFEYAVESNSGPYPIPSDAPIESGPGGDGVATSSVADNGSNWYLNGAPDDRWNVDALRNLRDITGVAFEVVYTGEVTAC